MVNDLHCLPTEEEAYWEMVDQDQKKKVKGRITFALIGKEIQYLIEEYPEEREVIICGDLMSGKDFFDDVHGGGIIDYDGILGYVFVNGYESNMGLAHRGLCQGGFLVDGETWLDMCEDFDVLVEWCNK